MSRWAIKIIWDGIGAWANVGRVRSGVVVSSEGKVGMGAYDFVASDRPSICRGPDELV